MSSLNIFQSALTAELAAQGLSHDMLWGGADAAVVRRVKTAALHTLLALYPPLRGDTGTVRFLQASHKTAKEVLDAALALAAAHIELLEHNLDVTPMLRKAGIPPHPRMPQHPGHPRAAPSASTHNLSPPPPPPRVRPWGAIEPTFAFSPHIHKAAEPPLSLPLPKTEEPPPAWRRPDFPPWSWRGG